MSRKSNKRLFEKVQIVDLGVKGKSIGKTEDGMVLLVEGAVPGDVVDIETFKKRRRYYEGRVVHFHHQSESRVTPKCIHFGECGGCKWQQLNYETQLRYKDSEVENALKRIGKVNPRKTTPILGCETPYYYRNKMEFSFSNSRWLTPEEVQGNDENINRDGLGFHKPGRWDKVIDLEECHLQPEPSNSIRLFVREWAIQKNLTFFDPKNPSGLLRSMMIRTSSIGEVMVLIQFFEEDAGQIKLLLEAIKNQFPQINSLLYVINTKGNDALYDQTIHCFHGQTYIIEEMEGLRFKINAKSFYQTNSNQAYELYKIVRQYAQLEGHELVFDLYSGLGTIAQFVSKHCHKVVGIESVPDAVIAAKENAIENGLINTYFEVGDMKNVFNEAFIQKHGKANVVITDPPREGMHKEVVLQLLKLNPERIVYVSCNPATQARDLEIIGSSYTVEASQAVDMFPHTQHVENVVLLTRNETH